MRSVLPPGHDSAGSPASSARLAALIRQTSFHWNELPEDEGYLLPFALSPESKTVEVLLLPGGASVWLLVPFEVSDLASSRVQALELANSLNEELPFGVYYVEAERLVYRNAIRLQTLTSPSELENFVLTSLAAIKKLAEKTQAIR